MNHPAITVARRTMPPRVARLGLGVSLGGLGLIVAAGSPIADATDFVIERGGAWPTAEEVSAGDRILLAPGVHSVRAIEGWPGTPERPIVITSADPNVPAAFASPEAPAFHARDCGGLHLDALLIIGGGVLIEDMDRTTPSSVTISSLQVLPFSPQPGTKGPAVGVQVLGAAQCTLRSVAVNRWTRTGVELADIGTVTIAGLGLVGGAESPVGLRLENCGTVEWTRGGVVGAADAAVDLHVAAVDTSLSLSELAFVQPGVGVRITGDRAIASIDRCTIVGPRRAVVEVREPADPEAPVPDPNAGPDTGDDTKNPRPGSIRLDRCLTIWQVGGLERIIRTATPGEGPSRVTLGRNLWWSEELPMVLEALG
ncbi:MAG: hypothetical protein RLZZ461_1141, partial [Planctomycetota bacterium]